MSHIPRVLYHMTTPRKAQRYRETGYIRNPVRGFDRMDAAMAWALGGGRTVLMRVVAPDDALVHRLPDHHNVFGEAYCIDADVRDWRTEFSQDRHAVKQGG